MNAGALNGIKESLLAFWADRNARERQMLALAAAFLGLLLIYSVFIGPALSGRAQLEKTLPALRQQAAEMRVLAKQAAELASAGTNAPAPAPISKESIEASLTERGLKPRSVVLNGNLVRVQLPNASFAAIVSWLDEMQKTVRLSVVEGNIEALEAVDTVNATLSLRQQGNDQKNE
ncbi:MAG TPA: type II secretion system protein GspM [Burkholderiaceae bacterium]|nr:type II secretion system protein GspM [Burkholderiaceae bacterium]